MDLEWEDGFSIRTNVTREEIVVSANREGLISLANILRSLANESPGAHVHLDAYNSLEEGSRELIIEKTAQ